MHVRTKVQFYCFINSSVFLFTSEVHNLRSSIKIYAVVLWQPCINKNKSYGSRALTKTKVMAAVH